MPYLKSCSPCNQVVLPSQLLARQPCPGHRNPLLLRCKFSHMPWKIHAPTACVNARHITRENYILSHSKPEIQYMPSCHPCWSDSEWIRRLPGCDARRQEETIQWVLPEWDNIGEVPGAAWDAWEWRGLFCGLLAGINCSASWEWQTAFGFKATPEVWLWEGHCMHSTVRNVFLLNH